jgi:hypothetical protein
MKCPYDICNGTGFIPVVLDNGEEEVKPCKCRLEKSGRDSLKKKRIDSHIPVKYWDYTLENYKKISNLLPLDIREFNKDKIAVIEQYITDPQLFLEGSQVLWLWGKDDNSCHTTLAIILAEELLKKGKKVLFIEFYKLLEMFTNFDEKNVFFKELKDQHVYVIDDAFDTTRCTTSAYKQNQLFGFINDVLNDNKHIICTSNCKVGEIDTSLFGQLKIILSRSVEQLEIRGTLTNILRQIK